MDHRYSGNHSGIRSHSRLASHGGGILYLHALGEDSQGIMLTPDAASLLERQVTSPSTTALLAAAKAACELLQELSRSECLEEPEDYQRLDALRAAIQAVEAELGRDGWIACSEKYPDSYMAVMVKIAGSDGVYPRHLWRTDEGWEDEWGHTFNAQDGLSTVTHWRELPAPPSAPDAVARDGGEP